MRRKHKKFIDPRYFMNEKAEMPRYDEQDAPYDTEAEAQHQQEEDAEDQAQTEAARQILSHLSQIQEILESDAARFLGQGDTRPIIGNITAAHDHFKDLVQYLEKY